jgi:hypothetical protein
MLIASSGMFGVFLFLTYYQQQTLGYSPVIAPSINTGTFGVEPRDAGVASATVTVGQQLGASIGTSLNPRRDCAGDSACESPWPWASPRPAIIIGLSDKAVTA